ncbi:response regulator [Asticcacaulis sp. AND118]|uniref:response regulator n=1 Tax=Asticcacaulis sp. AND118 TaxID=2840468 RepID=UPI001CFF5C13|nr:response regulator [Asticcacaulis sp. AND118]UDF04967.1 response regulator [Asticcacaulis sp. AND118]
MPNTILILEDSKTQARIVGTLFEKNGYKADFAHDRFEALHKLNSRGYALLVLDVFVGEENTLDYLHMYRKAAGDAPIAIMTAGKRDTPLAGSQALNKARRAEVEFLLPKPFDINDVHQICAEAERIRRRKGPVKRILVIEDDAHSRIIYRSYLEDEGFYVAESNSVEDALVRLEITRVDAILIDLIMPGIGGMTGIKVISATWPDVPLIAMTGYTQNPDNLHNALARGAISALAKPFTKDVLLTEVKKALSDDRTVVL